LLAYWVPFTDVLENIKAQTKARFAAGFARDHRVPMLEVDIQALAERNMLLTTQWYGKGKANIVAFYQFFIQVMEMAGVTAFGMGVIPRAQSADGWITCVDTIERGKAGSSLRHRSESVVNKGGASQKMGESAIDNTVLNNVMSVAEAHRLLVGSLVQRFMLTLLRLRQRIHLHKLNQQLHVSTLDSSSETHGMSTLWQNKAPPPAVLKSILHVATEAELKAWGIDSKCLSWRCLVEHSSLLADYGQLPAETQKMVATMVAERTSAASGSVGATGEISRLLEWTQQHPGTFLDGDKSKHTLALLAGLWSNKLAVVKRSRMEAFTLSRYIPFSWTRKVPLLTVADVDDDADLDTISEDPAEVAPPLTSVVPAAPPVSNKVVRPAGVEEVSRIRANECPYQDSHGMSIASGGLWERYAVDNARPQSVMLCIAQCLSAFSSLIRRVYAVNSYLSSITTQLYGARLKQGG
jgi:hypothetical protein